MDTVKNVIGIPYVTQNAILRCPFGLMTSILNVLDPTRASIGMNKMATIQDYKLPNIPPFGMCTSILNPAVQAATVAAMGTLTPAACPGIKAMMGWAVASTRVVTSRSRYLDQNCKLLCAFGGNVMIIHSGQGLVNPIAVPCEPLESNYELPGWLEGVTTVASLTPWGAGLNIIEAGGNIYNGKYLDAAIGLLPFKKIKKGGKLLSRPADKLLNKAFGTDTGKLAQKANNFTQGIEKQLTDTSAGKKLQEFAEKPVGKELKKDVTETANNTVEKFEGDLLKSLLGGEEEERLSDNADIVSASTGLKKDEFEMYTDYGQND